MTLVEFGFTTAMITLPVVLALTCGVAWPLFRHWIRRGYSGVAVYVAGGIIVATIGALLIAAAHIFCDFLVDNDFRFAMLLIEICGPIAGFVMWRVLRRSIQGRLPPV